MPGHNKKGKSPKRKPRGYQPLAGDPVDVQRQSQPAPSTPPRDTRASQARGALTSAAPGRASEMHTSQTEASSIKRTRSLPNIADADSPDDTKSVSPLGGIIQDERFQSRLEQSFGPGTPGRGAASSPGSISSDSGSSHSSQLTNGDHPNGQENLDDDDPRKLIINSYTQCYQLAGCNRDYFRALISYLWGNCVGPFFYLVIVVISTVQCVSNSAHGITADPEPIDEGNWATRLVESKHGLMLIWWWYGLLASLLANLAIAYYFIRKAYEIYKKEPSEADQHPTYLKISLPRWLGCGDKNFLIKDRQFLLSVIFGIVGTLPAGVMIFELNYEDDIGIAKVLFAGNLLMTWLLILSGSAVAIATRTVSFINLVHSGLIMNKEEGEKSATTLVQFPAWAWQWITSSQLSIWCHSLCRPGDTLPLPLTQQETTGPAHESANKKSARTVRLGPSQGLTLPRLKNKEGDTTPHSAESFDIETPSQTKEIDTCSAGFKNGWLVFSIIMAACVLPVFYFKTKNGLSDIGAKNASNVTQVILSAWGAFGHFAVYANSWRDTLFQAQLLKSRMAMYGLSRNQCFWIALSVIAIGGPSGYSMYDVSNALELPLIISLIAGLGAAIINIRSIMSIYSDIIQKTLLPVDEPIPLTSSYDEYESVHDVERRASFDALHPHGARLREGAFRRALGVFDPRNQETLPSETDPTFSRGNGSPAA